MSHNLPALKALIVWLRQRHDVVMELEAAALACLNAGDTPGYTQGMHRKAESLAALAEDAKPLLAPLPGELCFNLALALENFAAGARTALRLNSVFYMSALLYPDDHKSGDPDNLTLCIDRISRQGEDFC